VRDLEAQKIAVEKVRQALIALDCAENDIVESPILGAEGNREFLLYGIF
jgi:23S rRNA (cytidine1920-2'-O)/16S rRNA (cytidine1409-2'-O)-methyltransferase